MTKQSPALRNPKTKRITPEGQKMKKSIIVSLDLTRFGGRKWDQEKQDSLIELNEHLADGWDVVHAFPTSGAGGHCTVCIVILEKN